MSATPIVDIRPLPSHERHAAVFSNLQSLQPGESFELHNDHDPVPLQQHITLQWPGQFAWVPVETGPAQWRVRITRNAPSKTCCGHCGGG